MEFSFFSISVVVSKISSVVFPKTSTVETGVVVKPGVVIEGVVVVGVVEVGVVVVGVVGVGVILVNLFVGEDELDERRIR